MNAPTRPATEMKLAMMLISRLPTLTAMGLATAAMTKVRAIVSSEDRLCTSGAE